MPHTRSAGVIPPWRFKKDMRKIVCEVCGTSYPETASACPICGSARSVDARILVDDSGDSAPETPTYTYVKGGRFSKKNVRKRNAMKINPGRREEIPVRKAAKPRPARAAGAIAI